MALSPKDLEAKLRWLLAKSTDDLTLRQELEALAQERAFGGFTYLWGPALYRRNRLMHRPFILANFSNWQIAGTLFSGPHRIEWKGEIAQALEAWLAEADRLNDVEIFRRLYSWKDEFLHKKSRRLVDLRARFRTAKDRAERNTLIAKFDDGWRMDLDDAAALELYRIDPVSAKPFILKYLAPFYWDDPAKKNWNGLSNAAREAHDDDFYFAVYRKTVRVGQWQKDILQLAKEISDSTTLTQELERRHPEPRSGTNLGASLTALVKARGRDVLSYVQPHLTDVRRGWLFRGSYGELIDLALKNGWLDFWSALLRVCGDQKEFDRAVERLVDDTSQSEAQITHRLLLLAGPSREFNFGPFGFAGVLFLSDKTAIKMYRRFPELLRGPFKLHISLTWGHSYKELSDAVIAGNDEAVIDYLASRAITRQYSFWSKELVAVAERLASHYEALLENPAEFARRATSVLGQVPAYSIWSYNRLIKENRLARLLFERTATLHLDSNTVRDLLEAPEIHVQLLAFRALGLDDERSRKFAAENLDMLVATLLRPLHRKSRQLTFAALLNSASTLENAGRVLARARQAYDLPDKKYPKEKLLGLMGAILKRWPQLRTPREAPVIYGEAS